MTRGEALDKIWSNFDNLDTDLSLWTDKRSEEYNKALGDLKCVVTSLILSSGEYEKHSLFDD